MSGDTKTARGEARAASHQGIPHDIAVSTSSTHDALVKRGGKHGHRDLPPKRRKDSANDHSAHKKEQAKKEQAKKEQAKKEQAKKEQAKKEQAKNVQAKNVQAKNVQAKNVQAKKSPQQPQPGQKILGLPPVNEESPDLKALGTITKTPLPAGLKFPKELSLEQLQSIIYNFHLNETRTDILTPLPQAFQPEKSVFSFLYTMNTYMDPTIDLPGCPVAATPILSDDTASGLVWECDAGSKRVGALSAWILLPIKYSSAGALLPRLLLQHRCKDHSSLSTRSLLSHSLHTTIAVEKYGLGAILCLFAVMVMSVFAVKKRIFRAQRLRYRRRLRELGDNSVDLEEEKRRKREHEELARSVILANQQQARDNEMGLDFAASQQSLPRDVSTMSLPKAERSFDIRFEKLGLTLPTGVDIIKDISGRLITGRTCAVMGPSGAGKTTFLSILAGKVVKTDGSVKVNGKEQTLSLWKKLIGYVPQEDVMLADLTVREILMHSARMRQPVHMSHNEKRLKVLEVIQFLGLGHIMDSPIGDVETRGISGGERKRVNIGMELVASPSILFLDEPTSGLDSATSLEVCKLLKRIAQDQFLTVAAVVHSPSPHAFSQFDDLLLLGSGGRVVYSGPREEAASYFESIGYPMPDDESPADFFISLAAGRVDKAPQHVDFAAQEYDPTQPGYVAQETRKLKSPGERTLELFSEWESYSRNKALAKTLEKHAIRESDTMTTVRLSTDESSRGSTSPNYQGESLKQATLYPEDHHQDAENLNKNLEIFQSKEEADCHVSTMALHQTSRPDSPTFSVPISNLAGSSADTRDDGKTVKKGRVSGLGTAIRISVVSSWAGAGYWFKDVGYEFSHWLWSIKCKFTKEKDPVRETPSFGNVFILCFKRACLQNYRSQLGFLWDQSLHLACGLCVSFAARDMMYIPRQPAEICAMAPPAIQLSCATPRDDIRYVGMFMALGVFFAGISVGASTFGDEKAVYWRDTSAGMPTLPYYLAKILADVPRMLVAACMYTGAFIFYFAYRERLSELFLVILLLYVNAFALGYFVSSVVNRSMFGLTGTGMSLAWALVLSGAAPHLYQVMNNHEYAYVRWVWDVSAPRWGVEAFYLKEMEKRMFNELKHNMLGDTYAFEHYETAILSMMYIALGWNVIAFAMMKLLNRHKVK
ncbi:hypothetical protein KVV02_008118 [Mortierella alpina]|uniref:ABC transporter domain-containing protein n=1 Tax=Mortierella alpina TaxID=64518 RepID=A0A9P8A6G7_MORAP|nr:hypothetical protein KVV02_008118 [Mortierella alpina]